MRSKRRKQTCYISHIDPRPSSALYIYIYLLPPTSYHTHIPSVTRYLLILLFFSNEITALQLDPALQQQRSQKVRQCSMYDGV